MNPYLTFNGNCAAAFTYYAERLGGQIGMMMTMGESPMADQVPAQFKQNIMHASIFLNGGVVMGSDGMPGQPYPGLSGFSLSLSTTDPVEAERFFNALAEGGTVTMPLEPTFWAVRFGMVVDQFGVPWMVNCEAPQT